MARFFKRSAKVPITSFHDNDNSESCAFDTQSYRIRSCDQPLDIVNQNRLIENESNAERLTGSTSSVGELVSNFVNGIIGKMGKNRRKNKLNQQPIQQQQQQQQQSHLKKVQSLNEKQQPQHGKIHEKIQPRQTAINKGQQNEFENNHKSAAVPFEVNNKSDHGLKSRGDDEKFHRKLHESKKNLKNQQNVKNVHCNTFNTNNSERIISYHDIDQKPVQMKSASNCIVTDATDSQAKQNAPHPIAAVTNDIDRPLFSAFNEQIHKNSLNGDEKALHSCIEIDSLINGDNSNDSNDNRANNLNPSECKQLTSQSNNISSRSDANNNEVNIAAENVDDVHCDSTVTVNCQPTDSNIKHSVVEQESKQSLEKSSSKLSSDSDSVPKRQADTKRQSNTFLTNTQSQPLCNLNKNPKQTMGQHQSTNSTTKSQLKPQNISTNYGSTDAKADSEPAAPKVWHDAAATRSPQAPHYDKNKINFSNELNKILETETSSKQQYGTGLKSEAKPETSRDDVSESAVNEIKDFTVSYETSSNLSDEINSTVFISDGKSVTTPHNAGTVTENVNGSSDAPRTESNGTNNRYKTDTKIRRKNDKNDVTPATDHSDTVTESAAVKTDDVPLNQKQHPKQNDSEQCYVKNENGRSEKKSTVGPKKRVTFQEERDCESECGEEEAVKSSSQLKQNGEQSAQMEQNVLYRVDESYNSDDALELSDVEETVIDQNGKVIEVKTLFKQRPSKSPEVQFNKKIVDNSIDGIRTIGGRRRSNSITSLGIEIVEVNLNTNSTDFLTQQPILSFTDDSNAIKLSDLCDNTREKENDFGHAIDIVEIVEESSSESCSEYEEVEEEIEEEEIEDEIEDSGEIEEEEIEEEEDEDEMISADGSLSNSSAIQDNVNRNTHNAFKSSPNSHSVDGSLQSMQTATVATHTKTNHANNDNDVICVLVNGQPTRFSANTINNLSQSKHTEPLSHSHSRVNANDFNKSTHIDKLPKIVNDKLGSSKNAYEKSVDSMPIQKQQQHQKHPPRYSDDAMHLPDIVVGSTLCASNLNNTGGKKPIPLSRSPPKIVVNDNTLDSWTSNEDETGTLSDSFDESIEVDEEVSELTDDEEAEKCPNEKLLYPGVLNIASKNESNENQNNVHNEAKQHELHLLAQINESKSELADSQTKIDELTYKINELERDLSVKTWNVDRLQAELEAAYKELNCVKMKLKLQENEMEMLRQKHSEREDDFNYKYNNLEADHLELKQKLDQMQSLAISLQVQLSSAQNDLSDVRAEKEKLTVERDIERQALQDALDAAIIERAENDAKWQRDFEQLRTLNSDREELLLQDCEWKIRSTERACKERINAAEQAKNEAIKQAEKIATESEAQFENVKHLKICEAEVAALRGLTNEQRQSIAYLTQQLEEMKAKLDETSEQLEEATEKIRRMATKFASDLNDKDREMIAKIEEARYEVATMWEDRLLNEMLRLKVELETCFAEDRIEAVHRAQKEHLDDVQQLKETFTFREQMLQDEIAVIREKLADRNRRLDEANEKADKQIMQIRMILNKSEQGHQREFQTQAQQHEREIDKLKQEFDEKETEMRAEFESKINEIKRKSSEDLNVCKTEMIAKLKREYESNYEKFKAEKEDEQLDLQRNYKRKLSDADDRMRDAEILHQREIKDLQNAHSMERSSLEQRDLQNSQEIETLHRKCRCLTKLFDEMRIRYERREPRAEDIRAIEELKAIIDAQDRDLRLLTEKLRSMQMHSNGIAESMTFEPEEELVQQPAQPTTHTRKMKKPTINCDVIYEAENEEEESQPISA